MASDISRDRCHGFCLSATRIGGHDITIRPASSVVCGMQAITSSYVCNRQCLGPRTTELWPE